METELLAPFRMERVECMIEEMTNSRKGVLSRPVFSYFYREFIRGNPGAGGRRSSGLDAETAGECQGTAGHQRNWE